MSVARPRPVTSIAIALATKAAPIFRYHATSGQQSWSGAVHARTAEAAVLDVIDQIRQDSPDLQRVRFLFNLPARSTVWRHAPEIAALIPGVTVDMPTLDDLPLMASAKAELAANSPAPEPPKPTAPEPADMSPAWVATDGSVRGTFTGYGWLASTGEYGMLGIRHRTTQIGTKVVLISELRAIAEAVRKLRGRRLTLMSDSKQAIAMVKRWMAGEEVLPYGYTTERANGKRAGLVEAQRLILATREWLTPVWVRGHQGEPLNEGADALAGLASRFATGTSELTPDEYHRRACELAKVFAAEFRRAQAAERSQQVGG